MTKILAFSKNLTSTLGGAEKSLTEELKKRSDDKITICSLRSNSRVLEEDLKITYPDDYSFIFLEPRYQFSRFFFSEYYLNRNYVKSVIEDADKSHDELWAQNLWSPIAINSFSGKTRYFARDDSFLNIRPNVYKGSRYYLKKLYDLLDSIGYLHYVRDNELAIHRASEVIANSCFMADKIEELFGRTSTVIYPFIDIETLLASYDAVKDEIPESEKGIVLVGESPVKGISIVRELAKSFINEKFYIFGKSYSKRFNVGNICYMPWQKDPADVFKYAKITVMPSLWEEAYGRVAAESTALGIPCLVNNIGGLPEAVNNEPVLIADGMIDFSNKLSSLLRSEV